MTVARIDLVDVLRDVRTAGPAGTPGPKFARCDRKDARLRFDQTAALTGLAETLMRRRAVKAERITENTLIRIAIDLLLAHAGDLVGSTEDELRASVTGKTVNEQPLTPARKGTGS